MAVSLPVACSSTPTPSSVLSDKLTYPTSLHPSLSWILKLSINSKTSEPYLPLSQHELILTPSRQSDVPHRVKLLNDPTVSPFMYSPPNPYLPRHVEEYVRGLRKTEEAIIGQSLKEGKASVYREDSFLEIVEGPERDAAISKNLSLPTGDPTIIYTWYFLLSPECIGKGYMTLVLKELRDEWLVPVLRMRVIEVQAFSDNPGSEGVHLKLGFKGTGETELRMPEDREGMLRMEKCFRWEKA
ncbi:BQ5605_C005g03256 [Microbotryum silenes-dioicae]|uniref:BQ5605_C005g03256 protein n=1 Tax=Microbotryum silenes-dioicae TaxID=796604 RepID=A0A2X0N473_9BASI|nr:BQ5605_C005g03256 [Microbotryum silenes-dioicae]